MKLNPFLHSINSITFTPFRLRILNRMLTVALQIEKTFMKIIALSRLSLEVELWGVVGGTSTGIVMLISASSFNCS